MKISNIIYEDLAVGDSESHSMVLTNTVIRGFADLTGDYNPVHLDEKFANSSTFKQRIGHGLWASSLISAVLGTKLPGAGTIYLEQRLKFLKPVFIGETVTAHIKLSEKLDKGKVVFECSVTNGDGVKVISGVATVLAPTKKLEVTVAL